MIAQTSKQKRFIKKFNFKEQSPQVFIAPTEGLWGLSASALSVSATKEICLAKKRPSEKSFIVLYTQKTQGQIWSWVNWSEVGRQEQDLYLERRKKFITFLLPASAQAPQQMVLQGKISFRYIHQGSIKRIIDTLGFPILSTSANISGQSPLIKQKDLKRVFNNYPIIPGRLGGKSKPSLIVDLLTGARLR